MAKPYSRWYQSIRLRAMDLTSMRRSLGLGVGVGRSWTVRGEPLEGRMAARCWLEEEDMLVGWGWSGDLGLGTMRGDCNSG